MNAKRLAHIALVAIFVLGITIPVFGSDKGPAEPGDAQALAIPAAAGSPALPDPVSPLPYAPAGQSLSAEIEPNDIPAQATPMGASNVVFLGNIPAAGDIDYYAFSAGAGDRVYAATMTSFSSSATTDSRLALIDSDGVTVLEQDEDDGSFGGLASSISGYPLPAAGTYYLSVSHGSPTGQLRPYHLHLQIQSGAPAAESEPNDAAPQPLPASGWITGATSAATDVDRYSLSLNAGDTVFASLDFDPERDASEWNGRLGMGIFNGMILIVNDAGASTPDSEAFFTTVLQSGTYEIYVDVTPGETLFGSYHLSVSVHPAQAQSCTTYTSSDVPKTIPDGPGMVSSVINVPGSPRVGDLNVAINLDHASMPDIDAVLTSPAGNSVALFTDVGSSFSTSVNLELDDEAALPLGTFTVLDGIVNSPELSYRLEWFDGVNAGGAWQLDLYDDLAANGGTLNSWSLTVCDPPPQPSCPAGSAPSVIYSSDFEAGDGGFTHSGVQDEWERGLPVYNPITTCNSGSNCWVTDLDNTYNASSSQDLTSPSISLAGLNRAWVTWAQKSQLESATFDHASVSVRQAGGLNPRTLWQWLDATQTATLGNPAANLMESSGWGMFTRDISDYLGQNIELNFNLISDSSVQLAGFAVDDLTVTGCVPLPAIRMDKTVGLNTLACATTASVDALPGTKVTYCYQVTNTGGVALSRHTLVDSQLGTLLNDFPYFLAPGASAFLTQTAVITAPVINTASWTAYNPGPVDSVMTRDDAAVTMFPQIEAAPLSLAARLEPDRTLTSGLVITSSGVTALTWAVSEFNPILLPETASPPLRQPANPAPQPPLPGQALTTTPLSGLVGALPPTPAPVGPSANGVTYFTDRTAFNAQVPGLPLEDFEDGNVADGGVLGCDAPLDQFSDGACFNTGEILPGIAFQDYPGPDVNGLALGGAGFSGGLSKYLVADIFTDAFDIFFTNAQTYAAGMDLHSHYLTSTVEITTYALDQVTVLDVITTTATNTGSFLGITSSQAIGRINIDSPSNQAEGVDNLAFGNPCSSGADIPWVSVSPITGTLPVGFTQPVSVAFDSTGMAAGVYTGTLCLLSNAGSASLITLPLTMTVISDADLSLSKTAPLTATVGDTFTYDLLVHNSGPATALAATLVDTLPAGLDFVSASAGCSESGGVVTCSLGDLPPGASRPLTISVLALTAGVKTNSASVSSSRPDPGGANNSDAAATDVGEFIPPGSRLYLPLLRR